MTKVVQIRVGKHQTGVVGLEEALKDVREECHNCSEQTIGAIMVKKLSEKNYIPPDVTKLYEAALLSTTATF